jgi:hypothetical protein
MVQGGADIVEQAVGYCRYQAGKGVDSLVALMQRTGVDWQRCIEGMSEEQAGYAPAGEWSAKDVVNHFLEVTRGANKQIIRLTRSGELPSAVDEESLAKQGGPFECKSVPEMTTWLAEMFDDVIELTRSLEGNQHLEETFPHPLFGQLNILEWIAFQRIHSQDHIQQIEKNKADAGYPKG